MCTRATAAPAPQHPCGRVGVHPRQPAGYSLIECLVVCVIIGVLASVVVVTHRQHTLRAGRLDAVDALTRIAQAQEQYRALHGMYSAELSALRSASTQSRQGLYLLQLQRSGGDAYTAVATAQGAQSRDSACPTLSLTVDQGYPQAGPSARCWNR